MLDKREPQRHLAAAETLNNTPSLGASTGAKSPTVAERNRCVARAHFSCWSPPAGVDATTNIYVKLRVLFKPDGSMSRAPVVVEVHRPR